MVDVYPMYSRLRLQKYNTCVASSAVLAAALAATLAIVAALAAAVVTATNAAVVKGLWSRLCCTGSGGVSGARLTASVRQLCLLAGLQLPAGMQHQWRARSGRVRASHQCKLQPRQLNF